MSTANQPALDDVVEKIRRDAACWTPETAPSKLAVYLNAYGGDLFDRLRALSAEERAIVGIDKIRIIGKST